jgi:outer membrane protein OmpA-like peptidoglycan-associated protein
MDLHSAMLLRVVITSAVVTVLQVGLHSAQAEAIMPTGETLHFQVDSFTFQTSSIVFLTSLDQIETPSTIEVVLAADVLFDFDKTDIRAAAEPTLHELGQIIRDKARGTVTIQGFTDALGGDAYNQQLSERRANSVKTWLVNCEGLSVRALATAGFGARNPVAPNRHPDGSDDPEGRQRNRRVTIIIHK